MPPPSSRSSLTAAPREGARWAEEEREIGEEGGEGRGPEPWRTTRWWPWGARRRRYRNCRTRGQRWWHERGRMRSRCAAAFQGKLRWRREAAAAYGQREDAFLAAPSLFVRVFTEMSEEIACCAGSRVPLAWLCMLRILGTPSLFWYWLGSTCLRLTRLIWSRIGLWTDYVGGVLNYVLLHVTFIFLLYVNDTILMESCLASSELGVICDGLLQNWIILHQ
jgi:hypothetical protein